MPPVAAVKVKVSVRPVALAATADGETDIAPLPSGATVEATAGELARATGASPATDASDAAKVELPVALGAVNPGPPEPLSPYLIVSVPLPAKVRPVTLTVWPDTDTAPALAVV